MSFQNADDGYRQFVVSPVKTGEFCNNNVNTARYSLLSFLPLFFYDQFSKLANVYFLVVGLMEQIPGVSPVGRFITLVPLSIILFVCAVKEIIEDIRRRNSDKTMNSLKCEVYTNYWRRCTWGQIKVGDIIRVSSDNIFPADVIIISTSETTQSCYIQTASLDGETSYKIRQCRRECVNYCNEDHWSSTTAQVTCEEPNSNLYRFRGTMKLNQNEPFPIDQEQLILRGSQLKNTHWAVGVVAYTGHETKIMLNSSNIIIKRSSIDNATNWQVLSLMAFLLLLTIGCASVYEAQIRELSANHWYLGLPTNISFTFHLTCITFFILYHNIIPISLMVTQEIVKVLQSYFISHDPQLYSRSSRTNAVVKTSSIIEELGQINYIFSDKTGTLTCNEMLLREISIGSQSFRIETDLDVINLSHAFGSVDEKTFEIFIINLLLCNAIVPEYGKNNRDVAYQSSSPDETAIVKALARCEYKFIERNAEGIKLSMQGRFEFWKILTVLDFTSDRKRMSVIAQSPNDEYYLFTKGADNVILERLSVKHDEVYESTLGFLDTFARAGYRTLCIAYKVLSSSECRNILAEYQQALAEINQRQHHVEAISDRVESGLTLLGITGIEDKLQPNVSETITSLKNANIKIWMLTGDKLETAVNIGYSCGLLTPNMDIRVLGCTCLEDCMAKLTEIQREKGLAATSHGKLRVNPTLRVGLALVVTGQDLSFALDPACIELLLDVSIHCESVICCRVSPLQKKNVLLMIKERVSETTTLAIGDGANDCSMIRAANVGIGIIGKEGMQAANTADFAIGEFSHLTRLLFVHGAASYRRICNCIYFCFYKNIVLNLIPFFFNFFSLFSGVVIFSRLHLAFYNVCYSSLSPFAFGVLDLPCSLEAQYNLPYLYESIRKSSQFGIKRCIFWNLNGALHAFLVFYLCYCLCYEGVINVDGSPISISLFGNIVFTHTIIVITLKAALELRYWFWLTHIGIFGGLVMYFICLTIFSRRFPPMIWFEPEFYELDVIMYSSPLFWMSLVIPLAVLLPDFLYHCIRNTWFTPSYLFVTEYERQRPINWSEPENIRVIRSELDKSSEIKSRRARRYFGFAFSMTENVNFKKIFPRTITPKSE